MKYKTTDREQRENNALIVSFGYCEIQNIERYLSPSAYTAGTYGWRADFYNFPGFTISTGYAPLSYAMDKSMKDCAEKIKQEIKKLEQKLDHRAYAFQKSGDWDTGRKFIKKKINAIYTKALNDYYEIKKGGRNNGKNTKTN